MKKPITAGAHQLQPSPAALSTVRREALDTLFVGHQGQVFALSKRDGTELWKTNLKSGVQFYDASFVTVLVEGERVYAHFYGYLFCLDACTGEKLWTKKLGGRGYEVAMLAVVGMSSPSLAALVQHKHKSVSDSGVGVT